MGASQTLSSGQPAPGEAPGAPRTPPAPEMIPYPKVQAGLGELDRAAKRREALDPNAEYTAQLAEATSDDLDDIRRPAGMFIRQQLLNILVRLKKERPDLDLKKVKPSDLGRLAGAAEIQLTGSEVMALQKMHETRNDLDWGKLQEQAQGATEGYWDKFSGWARENPKTAVAVVIGGLFAIFMAPKVIKWAAKKGWEGLKSTVMSPTGILSLLGLTAVGSYLTYPKLKEMVKKQLGLEVTDEEARQALEDIKAGRPPHALQKKIDAVKAGTTAAAQDALGAAKKEGEGLLDKAKKKVDEVKDIREHYAAYGVFITEQNPELTVSAEFFTVAANCPYEEFMKMNETGWMERVYQMYMGWRKGEKLEKQELMQRLVQFGGADLFEFFKSMLKKSDHEDFEGKTVAEVMEMLIQNPDKYLDAEAVREAHEQDKKYEKFSAMLDQIKANPKIVLQEKFRFEFYNQLFRSGLMIGTTHAMEVILFSYRNAVPIGTFVSKEVSGAIFWMAEKFKEEGGVLGYAGWAYFQGAGFGAVGIGIPLFMAREILGNVAQKPWALANPFRIGWYAVKGGLKGIKESLKFPWYVGQFAWQSAKLYKIKGITPLDTARQMYYHKLFALDKWKESLVIKHLAGTRVGKKMGLESIIARAIHGQVEITPSLMHRLEVYKSLLSAEYDVLRGSGGGVIHGTEVQIKMDHYKEMMNGIDELKAKYPWSMDHPGRFDEAVIAKRVSDLNTSRGVSDVLNRNQRLAVLFCDETHPLRLIAGHPNGARFERLVMALDENPKLLNELLEHPSLLTRDHRIVEALAKGDALDPDDLLKLLAERAKVWGEFGSRELIALTEEPKLMARYTQLKDIIAAQEKAIGEARKAGRSIQNLQRELELHRRFQNVLLKSKGAHARFAAHFGERLDSLFSNPKALERFLAMDHRMLRAMQKSGDPALEKLAQHFKTFTIADEAEIGKILAAREDKIGIMGRAAQGVGKLKVKVDTRGRELLERQKWYEGYQKWRGTKFSLDDMVKLAEFNSPEEITVFLATKKIPTEQAVLMAQQIAATDNVDAIQNIIQEVSDEAGSTVKFSPQFGRLIRMARIGGAALSVTGTVVSGYEAISAFSEAASTSDSDRRNILLGKGGMWTANLIADGAGTYALVSGLTGGAATGAAATVGSLALPLIPLTYMGGKTFDSMYERTKTSEEWAQVDHRQLIHDWISTDEGAGDAYRQVFTTATEKSLGGEKQATRRKIAEALLNAEENRKPDSPANPDRMHYLQIICNFSPPRNYHGALELLKQSKLYADIMLTRRQELAKRSQNPGHRFEIAGLDVLDSQFDQPDRKAIGTLLEAFSRHGLEQIPQELQKNFEAFSDRYLIDLYCESLALVQSDEGSNEEEMTFTYQLRNFLVYERHIPVEQEYLRWMIERGTESNSEKAREHIARFQKNPAEALQEDLTQSNPNPAVYAMTELGKFFGYTGHAREDELRVFFDEAHGGIYGCYFDGENWYATRAGMDRDRELGPALNPTAVREMIASWREDPDNVIETRQDSVVDLVSLERFVDQVGQMANLLEKALNRKPPELQELNPITPEPEEFEEEELALAA